MGIFTKTFLSLTLPVLSIGVFASDADARSNYPANFDLDNYVYKANKAASPFESERTQQINLANEILDGKKREQTKCAYFTTRRCLYRAEGDD